MYIYTYIQIYLNVPRGSYFKKIQLVTLIEIEGSLTRTHCFAIRECFSGTDRDGGACLKKKTTIQIVLIKAPWRFRQHRRIYIYISIYMYTYVTCACVYIYIYTYEKVYIQFRMKPKFDKFDFKTKKIQNKSKSQFGFAPGDTEKSEFLDLMDFGDVEFSVETVISRYTYIHIYVYTYIYIHV